MAPAMVTAFSGGLYHEMAVPSVPAVVESVTWIGLVGPATPFLFRSVAEAPATQPASCLVPLPPVTSLSAAVLVR